MKNKNLVYAISSFFFLVISVMALYFFYIHINKNKAEVDAKNAEWQTEQNRRLEIKSLERVVKNLEDERIALSEHFVSAENPVEFFNSLEGLASSVGATAKVVSVNTDKENKSFGLNLEASGSFDSVYRFITLLENSSYKMKIKSIDLQVGPVDLSKKWVLQINLELVTFNKI